MPGHAVDDVIAGVAAAAAAAAATDNKTYILIADERHL